METVRGKPCKEKKVKENRIRLLSRNCTLEDSIELNQVSTINELEKNKKNVTKVKKNTNVDVEVEVEVEVMEDENENRDVTSGRKEEIVIEKDFEDDLLLDNSPIPEDKIINDNYHCDNNNNNSNNDNNNNNNNNDKNYNNDNNNNNYNKVRFLHFLFFFISHPIIF